MKYSRLGKTGINVSKISLGSALFGLAPVETEVNPLVHRALDLGINFFDCANSYGNRESFDRPGMPTFDKRKSAEELLGNALKNRRAEVVIATKLGEQSGSNPTDKGLSREQIFKQVEISLTRLGTDYIDIYYAHHPDPETPIEVTLEAMSDLVNQGKIRYFGLSNFNSAQTLDTVNSSSLFPFASPVCNQLRYNLVDRQIESEIIPICSELNVAIIPYSPLAGGLLSGIENTKLPIAGTQRWRGGNSPGYSEEQVKVASQIENMGIQWGYLPSQLAIGWLLTKPYIPSVIIGSGKTSSLEISCSSVEMDMPEGLISELEGFTS